LASAEFLLRLASAEFLLGLASTEFLLGLASAKCLLRLASAVSQPLCPDVRTECYLFEFVAMV